MKLAFCPHSFLSKRRLHIVIFLIVNALLPLSDRGVLKGGQLKPLRAAGVSARYTVLYSGTYRGPGGKAANYFSSHGGSCCLSPSICGHGESADRPACFYLPSISIQGNEACQGFTGTGKVSRAPGVSVV